MNFRWIFILLFVAGILFGLYKAVKWNALVTVSCLASIGAFVVLMLAIKALFGEKND